MPRNLVLCCDGTNNEFGEHNTNVVRLVQALLRDQAQQRLYYDPGVGTLPEPGLFTSLGKKVSQWIGLAFGAGLTQNVGKAYSYLMDVWEPGDRVFLFGFSRGAYTVRVLAGLLHALGLLPRGNQNLVPYVLRLFKSIRNRADTGTSWYWRLCNRFRATFALAPPGHEKDRRFPIHFLGAWDTVSSVGWVWDPARFPYTAHNPSIATVRHAVSIDERRAFFRQNLLQPAEGQDFRELWFPGVHADVGGGYREDDGGLWRLALEWMINEAVKAGMLADNDRVRHVFDRTPASSAPWNDPAHESLTARWWPAEFFPKLSHRSGWISWPRFGCGRRRQLHAGALLHKSALLRIRETGYAPPNLPSAFLERVRSLDAVPEWLSLDGTQSG